MPDNSPAFQRPIIAQKIEPRAVGHAGTTARHRQVSLRDTGSFLLDAFPPVNWRATIPGPFGTRNHTGDASRDGCPTIARRFNAGSAHKT